MTEPLRVVLVEDDEPLERQLAGALERALPDIDVQRTPDADDALRLVCDSRSRLLITEAQSDAVDGLALAACARRQRPNLPVIFLGDVPLEQSSERLIGLSGSHCLDKPPHLGRFVGLVARCLDTPTGFRGEVASSDLIELVQLVMMTTATGALHLTAPEGRGSVWLEQGAIVHAAVGKERGVAAFQHMLRWRGGGFSVDAGAVAPEHSSCSRARASSTKRPCEASPRHRSSRTDSEPQSTSSAVSISCTRSATRTRWWSGSAR
jgi:CheY-like chemotaxis protein